MSGADPVAEIVAESSDRKDGRPILEALDSFENTVVNLSWSIAERLTARLAALKDDGEVP